MKSPKKARRLQFQPAAKPPLFSKDSPLAKSPYGKLLELLRHVPADQIKVWPVNPDHV